MAEDHKLNLILGARKILSVNSIYSAKMVYGIGGRPIATIYKTKEAKVTEDWIKEQVRGLNISKNYPWITKDTLFEMNIEVIFEKSILLRDLDNCLKLIQDAIFRALEINDSHVVKIKAAKKLWPGISEEKIFVSLSEVNKSDLRYDKIKTPNIIWCEEELKELKKLPKRGIKPDILYWTDDETKADTKVFFLEPDKINLNTTMKISDSTIEPIIDAKGFIYIGILGDENDWGTMWKNIEEFKSEMLIRSKEYSGIKINNLKSKSEIYSWLCLT